MKTFFVAMVALSLTAGCAVVRPGQVGLKQRLGALQPKLHEPGPVLVNPFVARVVRVPINTRNLEVDLSLPSKEGLNVQAQVSILYRLRADHAHEVLQTIGPDYEPQMVLTTFRSAAADVSARFLAKDMHTAQRGTIEEAIRERMMETIGPRGFEVEAVLLKSIRLPEGLYRAVEAKLEAEQQAQRMQFVLDQESLEADRKRIEAEGIRDAQRILTEGLTPELLQYNRIEAIRALVTSSNAKVIITDTEAPFQLQVEEDAD